MRRMTFVIAAVAAFAIAGAGALVYAQAKAPDTVVLKGAPMGGVELDHAKHAKEYGAKCTDCHHASKPEKANKAENQKCSDCHTKVAEAPMKTKYQNAFHDATAKKGTCVDCHAKAIAAGKKTAPATCAGCHKKENG
jgi:sRNA-binding protein